MAAHGARSRGKAPDRQLIVLCGPAFSGKSTLARAMAGRSGAAVVCLDEINARRGLHGGDGVPDHEWAATQRAAVAEVERLADGGTPLVVVDDTACYRFLRDEWRGIAARFDCRFALVVLGTPLDVIRGRFESNARTAKRGVIRSEVFERHLASFEWPGDDEPHVVLRSEADVEAWLRGSLVERALLGGDKSLTL